MATSPKHRRRILSLAACGALYAMSSAVPLVADDNTANPAGVSVPESPGAAELLDKAHDKETQKQWKTAAEFYQEALSKYPSRVVPVLRDADKGIFQYSGIAPLVQERISKWPAEGLAVYRAQAGPAANDLLSEAAPGDLAALRNIFWNDFDTDAGKTAALRLMDADVEGGDFVAAAWIGDRLLDLHPFLAGDRGMITYQTAVAWHWAGDSARAHALLERLKVEGPNDVGSIGGKDVQLVDALSSALAAPAPKPTTRPSDADTYPSYGGLGGRGDISPSSAKPGASLNSVLLTQPDYAGVMASQRTGYQATDQQSLANYLAMGVMPVADAGALFFQDGRNIYAVDADSGAPLPGWLSTYPGDRQGQYRLNVFGRARSELLTVSVSPASVLAVMGQPDRGSALNGQVGMPNGMPPQMLGMQPQTSTVKLVCLDRQSGRELWNRTPAELPDSAAALKTAEYSGTPLIIPGADSVLVVARGSKENQFDDCYVVCLSEKTGQYRWSTYIGSATRNIDVDGFVSEDPSMMALANGRVFIMTNLGTVASIDPNDGRMLWVNSYNRDGSDNPDAMIMQRRQFGAFGNASGTSGTAKVWAHNPVVVSGGYVFALPCDTKQLLVYDAGSGEEQKRLPMAAWDGTNPPAVLLGVRGSDVCVTSDKGVFMIDWKKYEDGNPAGATRWKEADITHDDEHSDVCGRGFITADSIFVPTKNRLIQMSWRSGKAQAFYPATGKFSGDQGPGNILVTSQNVVVAGQTRVDVYTDLSLVRQKYESAMAASPEDPEPRIRYAEALFSGGQTESAIAKVDDAINLIGGLHAMRSGRDRELIFNAMLDFARRADKNADPNKLTEGVAFANEFYDRAAAAADSALDNANYRLARAAFDHEQKDFAGEVKLCQEVLANDDMRGSALSDDTNAGSAAEAAIDAALAIDASVYSDIETQAAAALKDARASHEADQLLSVATVYPNSKAAVDARQDAVHLYEANNQPEQAIAVLRRMYAGATEGAVRAHLLESITNDFLTMPDGLGPAIDRLCKAARCTNIQTLSQPILLADGTSLAGISYAEAIAKLRQLQADRESAQLPDFHLAMPTRGGGMNPFIHGKPAVIGGVITLIHPMRDFNRQDQVLTWGTGGLSIYAAGATTPISTTSDIKDPPLGAAWVNGKWLVWTASQLFQIDEQGKVVWNFAVNQLPSLLVSGGGDAVVDDTGETGPDDAAANNNVRVLQGVNGQIIRVQVAGGINRGVLIQGRRGLMRFNGAGAAAGIAPVAPVVQQQGDEQISAVQPAGAAVLISTSSGRVISLQNHNGQPIWQSRLIDRAVDQLLANAHFTVVRLDDASGSQIVVYETPTGRLIGKRRFGPDNSQNQLVNVALSEEATLALTLYSRVVVKDLYDPWRPAPVELVAQANRDAAPFVGMNQADQLVVKSGRLVCLYDNGSYARAYDLSKNADPTNPLQTGASTNAVSLRVVGKRVFILTSSMMIQHNLDDASDYYSSEPGLVQFVPPRVRRLLLGRDYAIVEYDPVDRGPAGSPVVQLVCYRRALIKQTTREGDTPDYFPLIHSSAGITDWLGADGGVYYLTKDNNLHLLRGARE